MRPLSGLEQKLYFQLEATDTFVVSATDIAQLLGITQEYARQIAYRMVKKQAFELVKPGLYARIPASILIDKGQYSTDPILIANKLVEPYFLSYYTAYSLHGLAQRPIQTIYITSPKLVRPFSYFGFDFHPVKVISKRLFGYEQAEYRGGKVWVSDIERTLLDAFDRPELCGGWEEVFQCLQLIPIPDWDKLLDYMSRWNSKVLVHRLGYFFSQAPSLTLLKVPDDFLQALRKRMSSSIFYFCKGHGRGSGREGKLVKDWNLIVDPELESELKNA